MQSSSTDKQSPDEETMTHNDAAEQILTLARIRAELQDPEQTKAQLLQAGFGEDDLDLRSCDTNRKYRIIIKNLLDEDFRKNLLAASESMVSKPEKRTRAQQVAEMAMDAKIKLEPNSLQSDSIELTDDIEQTPNSESSSQQTQSASRKRFGKGTIKTMQEQIVEDLGVDMSKWKQFNYTDRHGINQEATKYRWTGNEIPIKMQQGKTNIEKGEQYDDAMTAFQASQSTALATYAKALEGKPNADECKHIFKLNTIGANAVTQMRKGINLAYQFWVVSGNNVLLPGIITDETKEKIKRYTEQKNLEYRVAAMAMQYGTQFLLQLFKLNPIQSLMLPPEDSQGEKENFKACGEDDVVADVVASQTTCKLARTHSQYFRVTHELKSKMCKTHPYHRANKKMRKKWRMIVMSWGEDYKVPIKKTNRKLETNRNWMHTNMQKPLKSTDTLEEQYKDRVRKQRAIDLTADANRQQRTTGRNLNGNLGANDKVMDPNILRALTERRMEEDFRLLNAKQRADSQTFQDHRHQGYDINNEKRRLDVHARYNFSHQPHKGQPTTATISSLSNIRSLLHISGNTIWDQYCSIYICKNDTTNSGQSQREMRDANIKGNNTDNNNIRRDGMDNQSKQEQTRSQETNNIPEIELEHRINDAINNQVDEEVGDGGINQISATDK
ncbi:MAG: hypothetical protein EZS28_038015, partial [Streblomastix strix]